MTFGTTTIAYRVQRGTRRRKTVAITLDPERGVLVKAPVATKLSRLDEIVRQKAPWILQRLNGTAPRLLAPTRKEFTSGETFRYLGRQYRLAIQRAPTGEQPRVRLHGSHLTILTAEDPEPTQIRSDLIAWYRERAVAYLPPRVPTWADRIGVPAPIVLIRDQKKRWGSCSPASNTIRLNWRIMQLAPRLVDYILAHEVAHLVHPNHSAAFWQTVEAAFDGQAQARRELKALGGELLWR